MVTSAGYFRWLLPILVICQAFRLQAEIPHPFAVPVAYPVDSAPGPSHGLKRPIQIAPADPANLSAGRKINYKWDGVAGVLDVLECSTDLTSWQPIFGPVYGHGQNFEVQIGSLLPPSAPPPVTTPPPPYYSFQITSFPNSRNFVRIGYSAQSPTALSTLDWSMLRRAGTNFGIFLIDKPQQTPSRYNVDIFFRTALPGENEPKVSSTLTPEAESRFQSLEAAFDVATAAATPASNTLTVSAPQPSEKRYYRVRRTTLDSDGDHLLDHWELRAGKSSPFTYDTDQTAGGSPSDLYADWDSDGMNNLYELGAFTNPLLPNYGSMNQWLNQDKHCSWFTRADGSRILRVKILPGIAHGFRYQLQHRLAGTTNWYPIDSEKHLLSSIPEPNLSTDASWFLPRGLICEFKAPFEQTSEETSSFLNEFLRLEVLPPGFSRALETERVTLQNFKAHANACIAELLPAYSAQAVQSCELFERNNDPTLPWPWNYKYDRNKTVAWQGWSWVQRLDFSGVAWDSYHHTNPVASSSEVTLITPQYGLTVGHLVGHHQQRSIGSEVVFHDRMGNRHVRKVVASHLFRLGASAGAVITTTSDTHILKFDRPFPPAVPTYSMLPARDSSGAVIAWDTIMPATKSIVTTRDRAAYFGKFAQVRFPLANEVVKKATAVLAIDNEIPSAYRIPPRTFWPDGLGGLLVDRYVDGDSGGPAFVIINGAPCVAGHAVQTSGSNIGVIAYYGHEDFQNALLAWLSQQGGSNQPSFLSIPPN